LLGPPSFKGYVENMHPYPVEVFSYRIQTGDSYWLLAQRYNTSDIATYDKIEEQALEMADEFTDGIVK
jgi:hypothetical protein